MTRTRTGAKMKRSEGRRSGHLIALMGIGTALLLAPEIRRPHLQLVWNVSPSVPTGLYRIGSSRLLRPGDLVAVQPSAQLSRFMASRQYVEYGALLLKPVAGRPGDIICRDDLTLSVNGTPSAEALVADSRGRPLPRWSGCVRLSADQYFLLATGRRDSFDSRYFGPVVRGQIIGLAIPVRTGS